MFEGKITFVGGAMRTGTSLLQSVLCGAPESNDMMYECIYLREQLRMYATWIQQSERGLSDFFDGKKGLTEFTKQLVFNLIDLTHKQQLEPQHLVMKNPEITMYFSVLMEFMPETKYVVAVRDPKDVVASMIEVARKQKERAHGSNMVAAGRNMQKLTGLYLSYYNDLLKSRPKHNGRVMFIRYEDLVTKYDEMVPVLIKFTGLDLSKHDPEAAWKYTRDRGKNEMFDTESRGKRMTASNIGNYNDILNTEEAQQVDKYAAPFMKIFGYPISE
jgi:sulfotransferase family protein